MASLFPAPPRAEPPSFSAFPVRVAHSLPSISHYRSTSTAHHGIHSSGCLSYGSGQMWTCVPRYDIVQSASTALKLLCAPSGPPPPSSRLPRIFFPSPEFCLELRPLSLSSGASSLFVTPLIGFGSVWTEVHVLGQQRPSHLTSRYFPSPFSWHFCTCFGPKEAFYISKNCLTSHFFTCPMNETIKCKSACTCEMKPPHTHTLTHYYATLALFSTDPGWVCLPCMTK